MRDLGTMGEKYFEAWCAQAGLVANGSEIDRTGWDYYVEFPFENEDTQKEIHTAAKECKIQVKSSDKSEGKLSIKLQNLRRLITAQMPAFFLFLEFDGLDTPQKAFLVHVDNLMISSVLQRLHEIEQSDEENKFNKRTMTVYYEEKNLLEQLDGKCLKENLERYIGDDVAKYIKNKIEHLESTGYEDGFAQVTIETEGEENIKNLINATLGKTVQVPFQHFKASKARFKIETKSSCFESGGGYLNITDVKPSAHGSVLFRESKNEVPLSFSAHLYRSPLVTDETPLELKIFRIESGSFELLCNPFTGRVKFNFSLGQGVRLQIREFRDVFRLLKLLSNKGQSFFVQLEFEDMLNFETKSVSNGFDFNFARELNLIECAQQIIAEYDVSEKIEISRDELLSNAGNIYFLSRILTSPPDEFVTEFELEIDQESLKPKVACVLPTLAYLGEYSFGVIVILKGVANRIEKSHYHFYAHEKEVLKKFFTKSEEPMSNEEWERNIREICNVYEEDYSLIINPLLM